MDSLIKFAMLFDSLNQTEKQSFVNNIIQLCGMDFIKKVLFGHFSHKILSHRYYDQNHLKLMNETVSEIIHAREPNTIATNDGDEDIDVSNSMLLDDLTPPLLSNIASFLQCNEYNNFQSLNRRVYIGANSPFSLQKLSLITKRTNYWESLWTDKLKQLTSLELTMSDFNHFINPIFMDSQFLNLKELRLSGCYTDQSMQSFLTQNCIDLEQIQRLHLDNVGDEEYDDEQDEIIRDLPIDGKLFLKFLAKFKNLIQLDQTQLFVVNDNFNEEDIPCFPQLERVKVCWEEDNVLWNIVSKHSMQIKSFSGYEIYAPHLRELECHSVLTDLRGMSKLEMISFKRFTHRMAEKTISKLLKAQLLRKYLT